MSPSRFGDPDDDTPDEVPVPRDPEPDVEHVCDRGWVDADADLPVPCPVCRPWLSRTVRIGICPPKVRPPAQTTAALPSSVPVDARGDQSP